MRPLIEECILNDTRWDRQIDKRADYYAQLILARDLPLRSIERRMTRESDKEQGQVVVLNLGALARRGDGRAIDVLRRYVATGAHWHDAIEQLGENGQPSDWKGLGRTLDSRFETVEEIDEGWPWYVPHDERPWSDWLDLPGAFGDYLRARRTLNERPREQLSEPDFAAMTTDKILDYAQENRLLRDIDELSRRKSAQDIETMVAAIDIARPWAATVALSALKARADSRILEPTKRVIDAHRRRTDPLRLRMVAVWALRALAPEVALPLAREWRSSLIRRRRTCAHLLLERHATEDDLPWVRKRLSRPFVGDPAVYQACGLAQIVARFPESGPYRQLDRLFHSFPYSSGRYFILKALTATSPQLAADLLPDSLWDCQPGVRRVACEDVETDDGAVIDRLKDLVADPYEGDKVRAAARARI